ncbi:MAG: hypothetical protein K2P81_05070 [Bacteriovoracaceae bacterium]|nr:hypothetical protein [Bacteriovoracaceae bacterium]
MNSNLDKLSRLTPPAIAKFLQLCESHEFTPILVGGAVRDLLMGSESILDWDFELQHAQGSESRWQALLSSLRTFGQLTPSAHHVVKALHPDTRVEWQFAPPRLEIYAPKDVYSHGDFETKVQWNQSFDEAVLRRDFTINAMGAKYVAGKWELLDPLSGANHLKQSSLVPCSTEHFRKDPVRFLRAYRFALKYGFEFSQNLSDVLETMDLGFLSPHYVGEEARKSLRPFSFWNLIQNHPTLPQKFQGGILKPEALEKTYSEFVTSVGHSNALLAAVFSHGEGWHLLLPLGGKGENETSAWRFRRDSILALANKTSEDFVEVDEILMKREDFQTLCHLTRPPQTWMQIEWVKPILQNHGLSWIADKPWSDKLDVRAFPPQERASRKVIAWLRS